MISTHKPRRVLREVSGLFPWYATMAALVTAFVACYVFFVQSRVGQWIDEAALLGGQAFLKADATRKPALAFLDYMPAVSAVIAAIVLLIALIRRKDFARPIIAGLSILGATGTTQLLKHVLLDRPDLNISAATGNSFPSGHTTFAAAAMMSLFLVAPIAQRPFVALIGWCYAAIAGASTLVLGWHRPSDVLAAYLVAAFWVLLSGLLLRHWHGPTEQRNSFPIPGAGLCQRLLGSIAALGAVGVSASMILVLALPHPKISELTHTGLLVFLGAGLALIIGSAFVLGYLVLILFTHFGSAIRFRGERGIK